MTTDCPLECSAKAMEEFAKHSGLWPGVGGRKTMTTSAIDVEILRTTKLAAKFPMRQSLKNKLKLLLVKKQIFAEPFNLYFTPARFIYDTILPLPGESQTKEREVTYLLTLYYALE